VLYDVGPGYGRGLTMLLSYAAAGIVLMVVGKAWWERRRVRRIVTGRTTMFADAQNANREFLTSERDEVLARHGLVATDTGSIDLVPADERRRHETGEGDLPEVDGDVHGDMFLGAPGGLEDTDVDTRPVRVVPRGDESPQRRLGR
jgi:hypothetical protein